MQSTWSKICTKLRDLHFSLKSTFQIPPTVHKKDHLDTTQPSLVSSGLFRAWEKYDYRDDGSIEIADFVNQTQKYAVQIWAANEVIDVEIPLSKQPKFFEEDEILYLLKKFPSRRFKTCVLYIRIWKSLGIDAPTDYVDPESMQDDLPEPYKMVHEIVIDIIRSATDQAERQMSNPALDAFRKTSMRMHTAPITPTLIQTVDPNTVSHDHPQSIQQYLEMQYPDADSEQDTGVWEGTNISLAAISSTSLAQDGAYTIIGRCDGTIDIVDTSTAGTNGPCTSEHQNISYMNSRSNPQSSSNNQNVYFSFRAFTPGAPCVDPTTWSAIKGASIWHPSHKLSLNSSPDSASRDAASLDLYNDEDETQANTFATSYIVPGDGGMLAQYQTQIAQRWKDATHSHQTYLNGWLEKTQSFVDLYHSLVTYITQEIQKTNQDDVNAIQSRPTSATNKQTKGSKANKDTKGTKSTTDLSAETIAIYDRIQQRRLLSHENDKELLLRHCQSVYTLGTKLIDSLSSLAPVFVYENVSTSLFGTKCGIYVPTEQIIETISKISAKLLQLIGSDVGRTYIPLDNVKKSLTIASEQKEAYEQSQSLLHELIEQMANLQQSNETHRSSARTKAGSKLNGKMTKDKTVPSKSTRILTPTERAKIHTELNESFKLGVEANVIAPPSLPKRNQTADENELKNKQKPSSARSRASIKSTNAKSLKLEQSLSDISQQQQSLVHAVAFGLCSSSSVPAPLIYGGVDALPLGCVAPAGDHYRNSKLASSAASTFERENNIRKSSRRVIKTTSAERDAMEACQRTSTAWSSVTTERGILIAAASTLYGLEKKIPSFSDIATDQDSHGSLRNPGDAYVSVPLGTEIRWFHIDKSAIQDHRSLYNLSSLNTYRQCQTIQSKANPTRTSNIMLVDPLLGDADTIIERWYLQQQQSQSTEKQEKQPPSTTGKNQQQATATQQPSAIATQQHVVQPLNVGIHELSTSSNTQSSKIPLGQCDKSAMNTTTKDTNEIYARLAALPAPGMFPNTIVSPIRWVAYTRIPAPVTEIEMSPDGRYTTIITGSPCSDVTVGAGPSMAHCNSVFVYWHHPSIFAPIPQTMESYSQKIMKRVQPNKTGDIHNDSGDSNDSSDSDNDDEWSMSSSEMNEENTNTAINSDLKQQTQLGQMIQIAAPLRPVCLEPLRVISSPIWRNCLGSKFNKHSLIFDTSNTTILKQYIPFLNSLRCDPTLIQSIYPLATTFSRRLLLPDALCDTSLVQRHKSQTMSTLYPSVNTIWHNFTMQSMNHTPGSAYWLSQTQNNKLDNSHPSSNSSIETGSIRSGFMETSRSSVQSSGRVSSITNKSMSGRPQRRTSAISSARGHGHQQPHNTGSNKIHPTYLIQLPPRNILGLSTYQTRDERNDSSIESIAYTNGSMIAWLDESTCPSSSMSSSSISSSSIPPQPMYHHLDTVQEDDTQFMFAWYTMIEQISTQEKNSCVEHFSFPTRILVESATTLNLSEYLSEHLNSSIPCIRTISDCQKLGYHCLGNIHGVQTTSEGTIQFVSYHDWLPSMEQNEFSNDNCKTNLDKLHLQETSMQFNPNVASNKSVANQLNTGQNRHETSYQNGCFIQCKNIPIAAQPDARIIVQTTISSCALNYPSKSQTFIGGKEKIIRHPWIHQTYNVMQDNGVQLMQYVSKQSMTSTHENSCTDRLYNDDSLNGINGKQDNTANHLCSLVKPNGLANKSRLLCIGGTDGQIYVIDLCAPSIFDTTNASNSNISWNIGQSMSDTPIPLLGHVLVQLSDNINVSNQTSMKHESGTQQKQASMNHESVTQQKQASMNHESVTQEEQEYKTSMNDCSEPSMATNIPSYQDTTRNTMEANGSDTFNTNVTDKNVHAITHLEIANGRWLMSVSSSGYTSFYDLCASLYTPRLYYHRKLASIEKILPSPTDYVAILNNQTTLNHTTPADIRLMLEQTGRERQSWGVVDGANAEHTLLSTLESPQACHKQTNSSDLWRIATRRDGIRTVYDIKMCTHMTSFDGSYAQEMSSCIQDPLVTPIAIMTVEMLSNFETDNRNDHHHHPTHILMYDIAAGHLICAIPLEQTHKTCPNREIISLGENPYYQLHLGYNGQLIVVRMPQRDVSAKRTSYYIRQIASVLESIRPPESNQSMTETVSKPTSNTPNDSRSSTLNDSNTIQSLCNLSIIDLITFDAPGLSESLRDAINNNIIHQHAIDKQRTLMLNLWNISTPIQRYVPLSMKASQESHTIQAQSQSPEDSMTNGTVLFGMRLRDIVQRFPVDFLHQIGFPYLAVLKSQEQYSPNIPKNPTIISNSWQKQKNHMKNIEGSVSGQTQNTNKSVKTSISVRQALEPDSIDHLEDTIVRAMSQTLHFGSKNGDESGNRHITMLHQSANKMNESYPNMQTDQKSLSSPNTRPIGNVAARSWWGRASAPRTHQLRQTYLSAQQSSATQREQRSRVRRSVLAAAWKADLDASSAKYTHQK